jgi:hypothetical protein
MVMAVKTLLNPEWLDGSGGQDNEVQSAIAVESKRPGIADRRHTYRKA